MGKHNLYHQFYNNISTNFVENKGNTGGAIILYKNSQLVFLEQNTVSFLRNHAEQNGE